MKRHSMTLLLVLAVLWPQWSPVATAQTAAAAGRIDRAHSRVTFTVTKWGFVDVEGRFLDFEGTVAHDPARPAESRVEWRVRVSSVQTGASKRDEALQLPEYFDAEQYPELHFTSERVRVLSPSELEVAGSITMRGTTRPLTIRIACGGRHAAPGEGTFEIFSTEFTVDRYDFGIVGGPVVGPAISRDVKVKLVAAVRVS